MTQLSDSACFEASRVVRGLQRAGRAPLAWVLSAKLALVPLVALPVWVAPSSAMAQSESAQARSLFRDARRLMEKQRFGEACPKLQESLRLDPGMGTRFNLAHCWEKIGLTASAWGLFLDVASEAERSGQQKREKAARERAEALEPKLSRVRIDVPLPVPGLVVTRGGEEVGQGAWGTDMPVDPGTYEVNASAPGHKPWSGQVIVDKAAQVVPIEVPQLDEEAPAAVEAPPPTVEERGAAEEADRGPSEGSSTGRTIATIALAGVGVGGIVMGTIFGLKTNSETDAARALCTGDDGLQCTGGDTEFDDLQDHRDQAKSARTIAYISFGVGGAALIGATILMLTGGSSSPSQPSDEARVTPTISPGFAGVELSGHF